MDLEEAHRRLNIVQDLIPAGDSNRPGTRLNPTYLTIHNTDNTRQGAGAAAHARYAKGADARKRKVSWHYTVDDRAVYQSLPTNEVGWHAGSGNNVSIGIEICMNTDMQVAPAYERAALLVAVLAKKHDINILSRLVQHNHWTGKHCPRVLRDKPNGWEEFKRQAKAAFDQLTSPVIPENVIESFALDHDHDTCEVSAGKPGAAKSGKAGKKAAAKKKKKAAKNSKKRKRTR